jgi:hypothetical protein
VESRVSSQFPLRGGWFVGGGENPRLDGASSLSGWDNVRRIGVDARVACASSLSMSAYR